MPKVTNAFTTYQATANREDLSNAIYNIDPFDTPVMSAIRRRNVKNRIFDWQTEFLPIVNPNNAQVEGFSLANSPAQPTIRLNNVTQISERDATVSGTQEESDAAGKGSEMAHQMALASKVLKSDMETILCSRQAYNGGTDAVTPVARMTEGFAHWVARAVDKTPIRPPRSPASRPACRSLGDRRLRRARDPGPDHRGDARRCDAASLRQWRVALALDRAAGARSAPSRPSSAAPPPRSWSARPRWSAPST